MTQPPPAQLNRQQSLARVQENQDKIGGSGVCCLIPVGIAALVIASQYDNGDLDLTPCDGQDYIMDFTDYLYIGFSILYNGLCCVKECLPILNAIGCCVSIFVIA